MRRTTFVKVRLANSVCANLQISGSMDSRVSKHSELHSEDKQTKRPKDKRLLKKVDRSGIEPEASTMPR